MQIWAEFGKSALPICNYSQILYQFLTFTQNLKRSHRRMPQSGAYAYVFINNPQEFWLLLYYLFRLRMYHKIPIHLYCHLGL